jgi:hypothetical protein
MGAACSSQRQQHNHHRRRRHRHAHLGTWHGETTTRDHRRHRGHAIIGGVGRFRTFPFCGASQVR